MEKLITNKIRLLRELGINLSEEQIYAMYACKNEIQLDNCARRIIAMKEYKANENMREEK